MTTYASSPKPKTGAAREPAREKPWAEAEFRDRARQGIPLLPAKLCLVDNDVVPVSHSLTGDTPGDGIILATWGDREEKFVVEYKPLNTPRAVETAIAEVRRFTEKTGLRPLIIVPYLSEENLGALQAAGISGVDLSGNGVLLAADFAVWRTGAPNRFKSEQSLRNVYRGASSLLARALLLHPAFDSFTALQTFARSRINATSPEGQNRERLTKGTTSKVIQALEEDLIVRREGKGGMRLIDPARLLERLRENYRRPKGRWIEGKTALTTAVAWQRIRQAAPSNNLRAVATGDGSAGRYSLLSGPERLSLYVSDLDEAARLLEVSPTRVFPNVELIETEDETMYFDARERSDGQWASPIQVWLELSTGGPRERDAAETLYDALRDAKTEGMP